MNEVVERPWGTYEVLASGDGYQVKRLVVKAGKRLSLQLHHHRSEDWVIASGAAEITIGDETHKAQAGSRFHVPVEVQHRIANPLDDAELTVIEVQLGHYLGEDDIVRIQDDFGRHAPGSA